MTLELNDLIGKKLRTAHKDDAITQDYDENRLTIRYDDNHIITEIYMG